MNISDISIRRPVFPMILAFAMMFFGYIALSSMPLELMPQIDMPYLTIQTVYPGADAETIEREVTERIEDAISIVSGIKKVASQAQDNFTYSMVELNVGEDADIKAQEFRDKISAIKMYLPDECEDPVVEKFDINAMPIVSLIVSSPRSQAATTQYAEDVVKDRIQQITGVGSVNRIGGREREIRLWLDPMKLNSKGLTANDVVQIIASKNIDIPGGSIEQNLTDFNIKTKGRLEKIEDFNNIILSYMNGAPVYLKDVAKVRDGLEDKDSASRLNGKTAIALQIVPQSGANVVKIVDQVKEISDQLKKENSDFNFELTEDMSVFIRQTIKGAQEDIMLGIVFTVLVILLFLANFRMTIVTSLAIPTSLLAALATIQFMGYSLNMLTMLAMALSVGIVVDDTIVMIENIYRHLEMGKSRLQAAKEGAKQITFAILAASLSLLAVFIPFATMSGIAGEFFRPFGVTVAVTIFWSLVVSLTLATMLSSRMVVYAQKESLFKKTIDKGMNGLEQAYKGMLGFSLKARFLILFIAIAFFAVSAYVVATQVEQEMEPTADRSEFYVNVEAPLGTALDKTSDIFKEIELSITSRPEVKVLYTTIGGGSTGTAYTGSMYVKIVNIDERLKDQFQIMDEVRETLKEIGKKYNLITSVSDQRSVGGMGGKALQYSIRGTDFEVLDKYAKKFVKRLEETPGIIEVDQSYKPFKPELNVKINREKAAQLGVPIVSIASTIRTYIAGTEVTTYKEGGKEWDVVAMMSKDYRNKSKNLNDLTVRAQNGQLIQLSNLITIDPSQGPASINRRTRQREILISANISGIVLGQGKELVNAIASENPLPAGYTSSFEGSSEVMGEVFGSLLNAMGLGFLIVYIVLAIQFNSFIHPITIMLSVPLAFGGGWLFLFFFDQTMNMFSMVGMVLLIGIVIKNGILLIDFIIKYREEGLTRRDAILKAGPLRLRPILMTALSTIAGMLPLAMQLSEGSEMRAPMAFIIIGGMLTSTLLTLFVIPVVYTLFDDVAHNRLFKWFLGLFVPSEEELRKPTIKFSSDSEERIYIDERDAVSSSITDPYYAQSNEQDGFEAEYAEFQKMNDELMAAQVATQKNNENYALLQQLEREISSKLSTIRAEQNKIDKKTQEVAQDDFPEMRSVEDSRRSKAVTQNDLIQSREELRKHEEEMIQRQKQIQENSKSKELAEVEDVLKVNEPDFDEEDVLAHFDATPSEDTRNVMMNTETMAIAEGMNELSNQPNKPDVSVETEVYEKDDDKKLKFYDPVTTSYDKRGSTLIHELDDDGNPVVKNQKPEKTEPPKSTDKSKTTRDSIPKYIRKDYQSAIYPPPKEKDEPQNPEDEDKMK